MTNTKVRLGRTPQSRLFTSFKINTLGAIDSASLA